MATDEEDRFPCRRQDPGTFKYFLALQQDHEQMPRQQAGLFHSVVDRYLEGKASA
jgi:hypothetical protein